MNRICIHPQPIDRLHRFVLLAATSGIGITMLSACGTTPPRAAQKPAAPQAISSPAAPAMDTPAALPPSLSPIARTEPALSAYPPDGSEIPPDQAESIIAPRAREVIAAIDAQDMARLATFVAPQQGARFSPYAYVSDEHVVINPAQMPGLMTDPTEYLWGHQDGSGLPIEMTFEEYYTRFVYNRDFANAPQVSYNQRLGQSNTIDNSHEFYPQSIVVEYHFPASSNQLDWQSLRLVFQETSGTWYLVGIIHDQWTI